MSLVQQRHLSASKSLQGLNQSLRIKTQWSAGSLKPFSGNWSAKFSETYVKRKITAKQPGRRGKISANPRMQLNTIPFVGIGRPPCEATVTPQGMEQAKGRKRADRRVGG
jgi:hypothetical protein